MQVAVTVRGSCIKKTAIQRIEYGASGRGAVPARTYSHPEREQNVTTTMMRMSHFVALLAIVAAAAAAADAPQRMWLAQARWGGELHVLGAVRARISGEHCSVPDAAVAWRCYGFDDVADFERTWRAALADDACDVSIAVADARAQWHAYGGFFGRGNEALLADYGKDQPEIRLLSAFRDCPYRVVVDGAPAPADDAGPEPAFECARDGGVTYTEFEFRGAASARDEPEAPETAESAAEAEPAAEQAETAESAAEAEAPEKAEAETESSAAAGAEAPQKGEKSEAAN